MLDRRGTVVRIGQAGLGALLSLLGFCKRWTGLLGASRQRREMSFLLYLGPGPAVWT